MFVESKYNKSGLQHTKNGRQMSKQWISEKINNLQKKYPDNKDYKIIIKFVQNDAYRSLLWNLKINSDKLIISLKKVHDKGGKIVTSEITGREKTKINYSGNQEININAPDNKFHAQIVSWYKS